MIKVKVTGGLGNQLFQYASCKAIAERNNALLCVDVSEFKRYKVHPLRLDRLSCISVFTYKQNFLDSVCVKFKRFKIAQLYIKNRNIKIEDGLGYESSLLETKDDSILIGYFQSEKYFKNIREDLLEEFIPSGVIPQYYDNIIKEINNIDSLSVHIRRGDYVSNSMATEVHGVCDAEYFSRSVDYLKRNSKISSDTKVLIFSDDIEWCKENISLSDNQIYIDGDSERPELDMYLMSKCKNHIISNSTFSWWGAWLNRSVIKTVICPKVWFKDTKIDSKDLVPEDWIRL